MPISWAYLKRVMAGAIFGLYMAHLLYFLNPQIDVTVARLMTVTLIYGLICGALVGSALWVVRAARVRIFGAHPNESGDRTHGFGFLVLAAFVSSAIYWIHLTAVRIYLPIGAVRVLSKATIVITVAAFSLLLLWLVERNATSRQSRAIFAAGTVLIAASSFFLHQRRDSYRMEKRSVVVADIGRVAGQQPVIVVTIASFPCDWVLTAIGEGALPFFQKAREHAYFARLQPFPSTSSKALWATVATGKLPFRHGVTGRFSYRTLLNGRDSSERFLLLPGGVGFRAWGLIPPVRRISAQLPSGDALPFWMMFERLSFPSAVVNWPASTEAGPSQVVTDRFFDRGDWRHEVRPAALAAVARVTRVVPAEKASRRFDGAGRKKPDVVAALARDLTAIRLLETALAARPALAVVSLDGIADVEQTLRISGNGFPSRSSVKGAAVRHYIEELDTLLANLERKHPGHLLMVFSPSGPAPPEPVSSVYGKLIDLFVPNDPGVDDGFLLMSGPGAGHRENPPAAYLTDIVPTLLFSAGLPVGRDMDGRVLSEAFGEEFLRRNPLTAIPTYEARRLEVRRGAN